MATIKVARERFHIWQGSDFIKTFRVTDENGLAVDLTNYAGEGQLRASYKDESSVLATFDVTLVPNTWVDSGGTSGWSAQVRLDRAQTSAIPVSSFPIGMGKADIWVDNSIDRQPCCAASVLIRQAVTEDL